MQIFSVATRAIGNQFVKLRDSAARVAKINGPKNEGEQLPDIVKETAVRIQAEGATRANLAVIKSEDERLKHLLDTFI